MEGASILARVEITAYANGQIRLDLPNDVLVGYGLLHLAMDEMQRRNERANRDSDVKLAVVHSLPTDGNGKR